MRNHFNSELLEKLGKELEAHISNPQFSVEDLAAASGMSRSSLHRKLKKLSGQSISQFIREYRLKKGQELLINNDLTVSEVAYSVGFNSATYFNNAYRKFFGYPPGETHHRVNQKDDLTAKIQKAKKNRKWYIIPIIIFLFALVLLFFWSNNKQSFESTVKGNNQSIAILPFDNLSSDEDNKYFADGINEAILNKLTGLNGLNVISCITMEHYRNVDKTVPEIANELNVAYILDGSVQKHGKEIRISTRLIDANNDKQIWSQEYTSPFENVFTLQTEIAKKVATEMLSFLSKKEEAALNRHPTENIEAYQFFLMGNYQIEQINEDSFYKAEDYYNRAIELDTLFSDALVQLARIYTLGSAVYGLFDTETVLPKAKLLLIKALEIEPNHLAAHDVLGSYYFYHEWDFVNARKEFEKVKEISGHYNYLAADFFTKMNDLNVTKEVLNYQMQSDPLYLFLNYGFISELYFYTGEREKSVQTINKAISLFGERIPLVECAKLYYLRGEMKKARNTMDIVGDNYSSNPIPLSLWLMAGLSFNEGKDPQPYLAELESMNQKSSTGSPAWFLAIYYAEIGEMETSFDWLEKSFERREVELTWLKMEPVWNKYSDEPRYLEMLEKVGFQVVD